MKKLILILSIILIALLYPFSDLIAQYSIPSFNAELNQTNLSFIEDEEPVINSAEERKINVMIEDGQPSMASWVVVVIFSTDGTTELGPYLVSEGNSLEVTIDERDWGLRVNDYLEDCELSVWID